MTSRNLAKPIFPLAPQEYSPRHLDALVQAFSVYLGQMQNAGEGRSTQSVMTNAPTDPTGLETGTVWNDNSVLRIGGTPGTFSVTDLSVSGALQLPSVTTAERDSIASPAAGLFIFNSTTSKLNFYDGSAWREVTST